MKISQHELMIYTNDDYRENCLKSIEDLESKSVEEILNEL